MLDSTSNLSQSKILKEDSYALILKMTQQENAKTSWLKSLFWTIQDKSKTDIALYWIAILHISLLNSKKSNLQLTEELVKYLKNSPNSSRLDKLAWLKCYQPNQCVLKSSQNIHHSEDSPSETWNKLSPSELSRRPPELSKKSKAKNDLYIFL